jgi:hypothetical protein
MIKIKEIAMSLAAFLQSVETFLRFLKILENNKRLMISIVLMHIISTSNYINNLAGKWRVKVSKSSVFPNRPYIIDVL